MQNNLKKLLFFYIMQFFCLKLRTSQQLETLQLLAPMPQNRHIGFLTCSLLLFDFSPRRGQEMRLWGNR